VKYEINALRVDYSGQYKWTVAQLIVHILQGSAATDFRWGGRRFHNSFFCSSSQNKKSKWEC